MADEIPKTAKISQRFQDQMDTLLMTEDDVEVRHLINGSRVATWRTYILCRVSKDGHITILDEDAPYLAILVAKRKLRRQNNGQ